MSDPPFDPPLEDALRALPTPPLPAADRAAIRDALRAAAATRAGGPPGQAPAGGGPSLFSRPAIAAIALIAGVVWTAAVLRIAERGPRDGFGAGERVGSASGGAEAPIGRTGVPDGATPIRRTTPVAVRFVGGRASAASPAAARPTAVAAVAVRGVGAPSPASTPPATVPAVAPIEVPRDRPPPDPPSDPPARPRRPTVTPGPVLPASPTVVPAPVTGIAGTVRSDGAPLARAAVRAEPADHADGRFVVGATGDDGRYVLRLPPGDWRVVAEGEGRAPRWWPTATRWEDAPPVTVREGEVTGGIDFDLPPLEAQGGGVGTSSP